MLTNWTFLQQHEPHAATIRKENCFRKLRATSKLENLENCRKTVANDAKEAAECRDAELAEYMDADLVDNALLHEKCKYMQQQVDKKSFKKLHKTQKL